MRPPASQLQRPAVRGTPIRGLLILLLVNVTFAFLGPSLLITTSVFFVTCAWSLRLLVVGRWPIPPLLDFAFIFAAIFYYGMPGLFYLVYTERAPVPSMPLQQALVASAIGTFHLARALTRWKSWWVVVDRLESSRVTVLDWRFTVSLFAASLLWIGASLPGLARYMSMQYGTREVEQRSDMTIPLLGFELLAIVGMAILTERLLSRNDRRKWWLIGLVVFAAYGILCVFIFGARTRLVWALLMPAVSALVLRRLTLKVVLVAGLSVFALLPVFDLIGKARATFHINEPSLKEIEAVDIGDNLEQLAANSEMVSMAPIADHVMRSFGDGFMFGKYVGWAVIQAPPAFMLRPFGLNEPRSLSGRYTETYYPDVWHRGGAFGLSLSAESYCNFQELGGVMSGIGLFLFILFFESVILSTLPFSLALAMTADFMIAIARVNRVALESLPKQLAVSVVMLIVIKICHLLTGSRARFFVRPGDA